MNTGDRQTDKAVKYMPGLLTCEKVKVHNNIQKSVRFRKL